MDVTVSSFTSFATLLIIRTAGSVCGSIDGMCAGGASFTTLTSNSRGRPHVDRDPPFDPLDFLLFSNATYGRLRLACIEALCLYGLRDRLSVQRVRARVCVGGPRAWTRV